MVALVGQVAHCQPQRLAGGELPVAAHVDHAVARGGILAPAGEAGGDAVLSTGQVQVGIHRPGGVEPMAPAQIQPVGRHLVERFIQILVGAAQQRVAQMQPVLAGKLPVDPGLQARQRDMPEVEVALAGGGIGLAAGRHRRRAVQFGAGDVVADAVVVEGERIVQRRGAALEAQLQLGGGFGGDLRAAGIEEAVAAQARLVAFAQVGGPEGTRQVQVGAQCRADLVEHAEAGRGGAIAAIQPLGDTAVVHGRGAAPDPVVAQPGQHLPGAVPEVVLQVDTEGAQLAVMEGGARHHRREGGRHGLAAVGAGAHPPEMGAHRQQVPLVELPACPGIEAVGAEGDIGGRDVASQAVGMAVDAALHLLPVEAQVQIEGQFRRRGMAVAQFGQPPVLLR